LFAHAEKSNPELIGIRFANLQQVTNIPGIDADDCNRSYC